MSRLWIQPGTGVLAGMIVALLFGVSVVHGQSVDSLFAQARTIAFEDENYEKARAMAYRALDAAPNYHGIRVFVARTLAWEEQHDQARRELRYVLERDPDHYEALKAIIDVETWSDHPQDALTYANQAREHYPEDPYFMRKRASILQWMGQPDAAATQLNAVLASRPNDDEAREALQSLRQDQMHYTTTLAARRDAFQGSRTPWTFGAVSVGRSTSIGSITGRVRYAHRFSTSGLQFEVDAYPSLMSGLYAYVSGGVSASSIFPDYRFGASLYKSLPYSLTGEVGVRHLNFGGGNTFIYTGSLTKYWGNYMLRGASYVTPSSGGTSVSVGGTMRRYLGGARTYVELAGSAGTSAREAMFEEDVQRQSSWSVSAGGQMALNYRTLLRGSVGYDREEFPARVQKRVSVRLSVSYKF
ncbi:YaiO family outer membrane beta-barrel protein [Salinibacter sp. 10B]|uniref:YaiO family outer membrane beta-barrel protein n=1 Tax=Salinibacter sp. 10B TaxID=1923971 RepID=UPI0011B0F2EC|nr:YaiO family outer membrane beta-barrel protein [Salinibacter sp. 10B]